MKQNLLKLGMICLMLVFSFIAKAQDVTATWDFQHNLPEGINSTNIQKEKVMSLPMSKAYHFMSTQPLANWQEEPAMPSSTKAPSSKYL